MPDADVAVVGGGPGGAACAIRCAEAGLSVVLIERNGQPVDRPGESLHPGFEPLMDQLGLGPEFLAAGFPRHEGHWVRSGGERHFVPHGGDETGPWRGFEAWRPRLDAILLRRAEDLGATLLRPWRGAAPVLEAGRVVGVKGDAETVKARVVVDATGGRHWLARRMPLPIRYHSSPLIARFGYRRGSCPALDAAPLFCIEPGGWRWAACVGEGRYAWTALSWTSARRAEPPDEVKELRPEGKARRADVTWRSVPQAAGDGFFLVGDASAVLDPASSHGTLRAVASGIKAAHLIACALADELSEPEAARVYRSWIARWVDHDVEVLRQRYAGGPRLFQGTTSEHGSSADAMRNLCRERLESGG